MWQSAHDTYLEDRILSADSLELVDLLYQACATAVEDARRRLVAGEILPRARSISKACDILLELTASLDHERGGALSRRLAELYGYMHRLLLDANYRQSAEALEEVAGLLTILQEAWQGVMQDARRTARRQTPWMHAMAQEPELAHASGGWSF